MIPVGSIRVDLTADECAVILDALTHFGGDETATAAFVAVAAQLRRTESLKADQAWRRHQLATGDPMHQQTFTKVG